jgi:hypothetical protein
VPSSSGICEAGVPTGNFESIQWLQEAAVTGPAKVRVVLFGG